MCNPGGAEDAVVVVARSQPIADGLGALVHSHDDCVIAEVPVQTGLEAVQKLLQHLRKGEAVACKAKVLKGPPPLSWLTCHC